MPEKGRTAAKVQTGREDRRKTSPSVSQGLSHTDPDIIRGMLSIVKAESPVPLQEEAIRRGCGVEHLTMRMGQVVRNDQTRNAENVRIANDLKIPPSHRATGAQLRFIGALYRGIKRLTDRKGDSIFDRILKKYLNSKPMTDKNSLAIYAGHNGLVIQPGGNFTYTDDRVELRAMDRFALAARARRGNLARLTNELRGKVEGAERYTDKEVLALASKITKMPVWMPRYVFSLLNEIHNADVGKRGGMKFTFVLSRFRRENKNVTKARTAPGVDFKLRREEMRAERFEGKANPKIISLVQQINAVEEHIPQVFDVFNQGNDAARQWQNEIRLKQARKRAHLLSKVSEFYLADASHHALNGNNGSATNTDDVDYAEVLAFASSLLQTLLFVIWVRYWSRKDPRDLRKIFIYFFPSSDLSHVNVNDDESDEEFDFPDIIALDSDDEQGLSPAESQIASSHGEITEGDDVKGDKKKNTEITRRERNERLAKKSDEKFKPTLEAGAAKHKDTLAVADASPQNPEEKPKPNLKERCPPVKAAPGVFVHATFADNWYDVIPEHRIKTLLVLFRENPIEFSVSIGSGKNGARDGHLVMEVLNDTSGVAGPSYFQYLFEGRTIFSPRDHLAMAVAKRGITFHRCSITPFEDNKQPDMEDDQRDYKSRREKCEASCSMGTYRRWTYTVDCSNISRTVISNMIRLITTNPNKVVCQDQIESNSFDFTGVFSNTKMPTAHTPEAVNAALTSSRTMLQRTNCINVPHLANVAAQIAGYPVMYAMICENVARNMIKYTGFRDPLDSTA